MSDSTSPMPGATPQPSGRDVRETMARWAELLSELSALHARLEYVRLMLRLGVSAERATR